MNACTKAPFGSLAIPSWMRDILFSEEFQSFGSHGDMGSHVLANFPENLVDESRQILADEGSQPRGPAIFLIMLNVFLFFFPPQALPPESSHPPSLYPR
jgi:hypothetical protein